ncbi:unnamed protein product [Urochloa humidicola]
MPPPTLMPRPGPDHAPLAEMTAVELEATLAALPGKRDALREAFDRLAACSPSPLLFAWVDIDAHLSSLHSSISLRVRQVRALEAALAAAAPAETRADGMGENLEEEEEEEEEEVVEVEEQVEEEVMEVVEMIDEEVLEVEEEVEEEEEEVFEVEEFVEQEEEKDDGEMQERDNDEADDKIGEDGKDEEAMDEVLQEEEVAEVVDDRISNNMKDDKEAMGKEQAASEEMQVANEEMQSTEDAEKASQEKEDANMEEEQSTEDATKASQEKDDANMEEKITEDAKKSPQDKEDASMEEEQDTDMEEAVTKKASTAQGKEEEACGEEKREQKSHEEEVAKNVVKEDAAVPNEPSQDQGSQTLPGGFSDRGAACADMDAQRLVKLLFTTTGLNLKLQAALHRAPDAAALALHIVELFLHDKMLKTNKAWVNCVGLIRMVPVVVTELSAETIELAKPVAKDWKEMIDSPECCMVLGSLASWGLLYFLISYNIVSEFETKEIFCLFATMPRKQQKMNYAMLFKDLQLTDRIPELMDYFIENGQQMDVLYWARVFNLVDKYPPVSLLKGYVEKAKQTAIEISQKNMTDQSLSVVIKELDNLRRAQVHAERQIADPSLSTSIRAEISDLLEEFGKRKKRLAESNTTSTSNSQQQNEPSKKHKKEKDHKGQENQQQGKQSKPGEKLDKKLGKAQQKQQQQKQEDKPQEKQQQSKQQDAKQKQQQSKQQHVKRPRQHTPKLSAWASPMVQNVPLRDHFGHPPYTAIHGVYHGYPAQSGWLGVPCVPPFPPQHGAPEYIMPFNPFNPHPKFYPW